MIDDIPNRPLYFYQKGIIGVSGSPQFHNSQGVVEVGIEGHHPKGFCSDEMGFDELMKPMDKGWVLPKTWFHED